MSWFVILRIFFGRAVPKVLASPLTWIALMLIALAVAGRFYIVRVESGGFERGQLKCQADKQASIDLAGRIIDAADREVDGVNRAAGKLRSEYDAELRRIENAPIVDGQCLNTADDVDGL